MSATRARENDIVTPKKRKLESKPEKKKKLTHWRGSAPLILLLENEMKIVTEEFEELFKDYPLYSQENAKDPLVVSKLFDHIRVTRLDGWCHLSQEQT